MRRFSECSLHPSPVHVTVKNPMCIMQRQPRLNPPTDLETLDQSASSVLRPLVGSLPKDDRRRSTESGRIWVTVRTLPASLGIQQVTVSPS